MKYYAVKGIDYKNIFNTWDEAKDAISKVEKVKYKSFSTLEEANAFLNDEEVSDNVDEPKCYIDGSFDSISNRYSFGGVLIIGSDVQTFKKGYEPDEYAEFRNVAGEIKGAAFIINYCANRNIPRLHIFYDYIGIEKWYKGEWKANTIIAQKYVEFADNIRNRIEVIFHKVKSHTNNKYNDMADKLAKEALVTENDL